METALAVRETLRILIDVILYVCVYFTGTLFLFAYSDLRLTAPMIVWLVSYLLLLHYYVPRLLDISNRQAEASASVTGRVVDSYTNIASVIMYSHASHEDAYAHEGMTDLLDKDYGQMRLSTSMTSIMVALNAALLFSVAALSIWLWHINAISTGAIAFAIGLVLRLTDLAYEILWDVSDLFENIGVVQNGMETISRDNDVLDVPDARELKVTKGEIAFENIYFNYSKQPADPEQGVIAGLTLSIGQGERIGLVGRSGAGKSTLAHLLLRFYDIEKGRILIDGQDISQVRQYSLRNRIAMVSQDVSLLHRSVTDNIRYADPNATEQEVIAVAKKAHAHEFIEALEDSEGRTGYLAHVGERGVKLSGGQRQRIAIGIPPNAPSPARCGPGSTTGTCTCRRTTTCHRCLSTTGSSTWTQTPPWRPR